jgi:hypothetical protein
MIEVVPFNFEEIKLALKEKVKESNVFKDIDYDGSNISVLINLLASASSIVNANTSFGINEMLLSDAVERDNILKTARNIGYEALRRKSAEFEITLVPKIPITEWSSNEIKISISKYTRFTANDGMFCYYMGDDFERIISKEDVLNYNDQSKITIKVKEGLLITQTERDDFNYIIGTFIDYDGQLKTESSILVYEDNVEEDGIEVFVTSSEDINVYFQVDTPTMVPKGSLWVRTDYANGLIKDILQDTNVYVAKNDNTSSIMKGEWEFLSSWKNTTNSIIQNYKNNPMLDIQAVEPMNNRPFHKRKYFVIDDEVDNNKDSFLPLLDFDTNFVRVYFRYGNTGKSLYPGSKVSVNVLKSNGALGNIITSIGIEDPILKENVDFLGGSVPKLVSVGSEIESNENIKINAPIFYNTANRAVTAKDYQAICERRTEVQRCMVWGGEEKIEKEIGNVYLSFLSSVTSNASDKFTHDYTNSIFRMVDTDIYDSTTGIALEPNANTFFDSKMFLNTANVNDILKYLERYKIMTMNLIHRNPIFIDCDFKIKVMRYINDSKSTQLAMFNIINSFFKSDMNEFGVEYFNSNIIRMIDNQLGNISGVDVDVEYSINLSTGNMIKDGDNYMFQFYLELPFEAMYDESTPEKLLILENMPNLNTTDFIKNNNVTIDHSLIVDYTRVKHTIDKATPYQVAGISQISDLDVLPIVFAGKDVGQFIIRNGFLDSDNYIRVDIWLNNGSNGTDVYSQSSLLKTYFSQPQKIRLANKTDNVRFFRNSIPRLNSVQFI